MRRERDWNVIEKLASENDKCIKPQGTAYKRAKRDFENHPDIVSYYSFDSNNGKRGYMRTLNLENKVYIDLITGWIVDQQKIIEFTKRIGRIRDVYIQADSVSNSVAAGKEITILDFTTIAPELEHKAYCHEGERYVVKLNS